MKPAPVPVGVDTRTIADSIRASLPPRRPSTAMPPRASAATPAAYGQRRCGRAGGGGAPSCGIGGTYGCNATGALASAITGTATGIGACGWVPYGFRAGGGGGGKGASALAAPRNRG